MRVGVAQLCGTAVPHSCTAPALRISARCGFWKSDVTASAARSRVTDTGVRASRCRHQKSWNARTELNVPVRRLRTRWMSHLASNAGPWRVRSVVPVPVRQDRTARWETVARGHRVRSGVRYEKHVAWKQRLRNRAEHAAFGRLRATAKSRNEVPARWRLRRRRGSLGFSHELNNCKRRGGENRCRRNDSLV